MTTLPQKLVKLRKPLELALKSHIPINLEPKEVNELLVAKLNQDKINNYSWFIISNEVELKKTSNSVHPVGNSISSVKNCKCQSFSDYFKVPWKEHYQVLLTKPL